MNRYLIYRISSKSFEKSRVDGISKIDSLQNLIAIFPDWKLICIADNCESSVLNQLQGYHFYGLHVTTLGHDGSFFHQVTIATQNFNDDDYVYLIEDDYFHKVGAQLVLEEGLQRFDYVTLYDHPDKYGIFEGISNPYARGTFLSEPTRVWKGKHALWRTSNSTTLSFACQVKTLKHDKAIWMGRFNRERRAKDFYTWLLLTRPGLNGGRLKLKFILRQLFAKCMGLLGYPKRTLGVPIPSYSAHLEQAYLPDNFPFK